MNNYRHGDLALIGIKELPKGIKETKSNVIMQGSHGNDHMFEKGKLYLKNDGDFVIGYFVAESGCKLHHVDHGVKIKGKEVRESKIKKGIYELRKQCEDTHDGMKQVID